MNAQMYSDRQHQLLQNQGTQRQRQGFSLLEVIIATAILMGSAVVLSRLAGMGREQAQKARRFAIAQQLCEQTLNEILLGQRSVQPTEDQPLLPLVTFEQQAELLQQDQNSLDGLDALQSSETMNRSTAGNSTAIDETNPEWLYSLRTEPQPETPGLWTLTIEVRSAQPATGRPVRFSLTRWISGPAPAGAFDELQFRSSPDELDTNEFSAPDTTSTATGFSGGQP